MKKRKAAESVNTNVKERARGRVMDETEHLASRAVWGQIRDGVWAQHTDWIKDQIRLQGYEATQSNGPVMGLRLGFE